MIRKITKFLSHKAYRTSFVALASVILSNTVNGQILITENFGTNPPAGWVANNITSTTVNWTFNNPGSRSISGGTPGFDANFAILDSDNQSASNENAALESPAFNASLAGTYMLEYDNQYRNVGSGDGIPTVEVWNGTAWVTVLTYSTAVADGYPNPASHKSINITSAAGGSAAAKVRFHWSNGSDDWWWAIDNVTITRVNCTAPTANFTVAPDCSNNQFSINVSITNMGDATSIGINDGTNSYGPATSTGTVVAGPYTTGLSKTITLVHNGNAVCNVVSAPQTYNCPPANDEASAAAALTVNANLACAVTTNGTTVGATQSADAAPGCSATGINDDVWYSFTSTAGAHQFKFTNVTTGTMAVALYTGTPGNLTPVANACGSGATVDIGGLTPSTVYYARLFTTAAAGTATSFTVCVGVLPAMTYVSSTTTQSSTSAINAGSIGQQIIRTVVVTTGLNSALSLTQLNYNTTGSTAALTDIANAKVYYSGSSTTLDMTTQPQFGTTVVNPNGTFTVTGTQTLAGGASNTNNYFWLVYDLSCSAVNANVVDAQCTSVTVGGTAQTPTATNPTGTRTITGLLATTQPSTSAVTAGSLNNQILRVDILPCGASSIVEGLTFTTTGTTNVADITSAKVYYTTSTTFSTTTPYGTAVANPNGTFTVAGSQTITAIGYFWLVYDLPCNATASNVIDASCSSITLSGTSFIPATANPAGTRTINSLLATNQPSTSSAVSGSLNNQILRVAVSPCGASSTVQGLTFATTGTTNVGDITSAKVYYTTSTTFSTATPFGTAVSNPNGTFNVTGNQPITAIGYFWLVYDLNCNATVANVIDAECTAVNMSGSDYIPGTPNPTGTRAISSQLATNQPSTSSTSGGSLNNQILRVDVLPCGASSTVESLAFATTGSTNAADIASAKVYYTTSTTFATTTPFGTAFANPNGTFTVTGSQAISATGYFWLVYDLACNPTVANVIDAAINSVTMSGVTYTPATANPTGTRAITNQVSTTQPSISSAIAGSVDNQILRVDVNPCGATSTVQSLTFATTGSTNAADISAAKVYYTSSTTFSNSIPFGTATANPNGTFTITGNQTISATGYFWLVYDLNCAAVATDLLDASCTALMMSSTTYAPTTPNPTGTRPVTAATFTASTVQPLTSNVPAGGTYQQVLRVDLTGCASSLITELNFSTAGSTSASNIANAKVFYTPTTTFSAATQFGSTIVSPSGNFTVTGSQLLGNTTGYFWLVYDIAPGAVATNVVDASCISAVVAGSPVTPGTPNPTGTRTIVVPVANDEAVNAITLTVDAGCTGNPYDNTNSFQSITEPFPSCKGTAGFGGMWFKFVAPASGMVQVSCDGSGTFGDSRMALFSATDVNNYGTFTILACDDDNGVTTSARSLFYAAGLTPGTTYYVLVDLFTSSTTRGLYCVTINNVASSMIATTAGDCSADQASIGSYNTNYTGWISLVDASGNLNANVRQLAGTATAFASSRTIKTGTARTDAAGLAYLNRNFLISGSGATSADVQLFFTDAEVTNLGASLASLNVSRVSGTSCSANFAGTATALTQTASGSANGISYIQFNTPGFSNFYVMSGLTPLPLKLSSFEGRNLGAVNSLIWTTASEKDASHFDVLRSDDGTRFEKLTTVDAKNVMTGSKYEFTDTKPFEGKNFYRLNMVDVNGKSAYSDVVVLSVKSSGSLSLVASPNPVNQTLNVSINGKIDGKAMIQVVDITGKIVQKIQVTSNDTGIDMSALSNGTYIIKYNDSSNVSVIKVIKN